MHLEGLVLVLEEFVHQVEHGQVELQAKHLADIGDGVELIGVAAAEIDGHHVALMLHALGDEGLVPRQVANHAVPTARAEARGKHQYMVIARKSGFDHGRKLPGLLSRLVDGNTQRCEAGQEHKQVVHQILDATIIVRT